MITLTNVGATYDAIPASRGLGFQDLDFGGVTQVTFRCRWNKIASGASTLSWQLWNETDAAEIARIDDAGAAGDNKTQAVTVSVALTGIKTVRVRCKSTVPGDDPVFYGASVSVIRP